MTNIVFGKIKFDVFMKEIIRLFKGIGCYRSGRPYFGNHTEQGCLYWRELYEISETPTYFFNDESWEEVGNKCR